MKVAVVLGTRPEAIKLAPVILEMRRNSALIPLVVNTGQHREMSKQALACFDIEADIDLDVMTPCQTLGQLTAKLFSHISELIQRERPSWIIVQGDTTSAMVAATCGFYGRVPVGHVEAGLRTFQIDKPFPEEMNRTFIGHVASLHFAPTEGARANLRRAGIPEERIVVTGNTAVDAVRLLRPSLIDRELPAMLQSVPNEDLKARRIVLVTCHRRESFGKGIEGICSAIRRLIDEFSDIVVIFPVHPNPSVQTPVYQLLGDIQRVHLLSPMDYIDLMTVVEHSSLILSDSGGLQEEAPSFGKPILILRDVTERPEVVQVGAGRLVGTDPEMIALAARTLLTDSSVYDRMANAGNPFGDGQAASRIIKELLRITE